MAADSDEESEEDEPTPTKKSGESYCQPQEKERMIIVSGCLLSAAGCRPPP